MKSLIYDDYYWTLGLNIQLSCNWFKPSILFSQLKEIKNWWNSYMEKLTNQNLAD